MTMYALADHLHKMVCEIEPMPASEYMGWLAYLEIKSSAADGNLLNKSEDELIRGLTR